MSRQADLNTSRSADVLEPRFFPRADVDLAMTLVTRTAKFGGRVANLSEGGALVFAKVDLTTDTPVQVVVTLPGSTVALTINAYVVRSVAQADGTFAVATTFVDLTEAEAETLRALVSETNRMAWDGGSETLPRDMAERLVPQIRRLARGLAQRLPPQVCIDDLVGAGFLALVELYGKSRHMGPSEFERIAIPRVRWAMLDELRNSDPLSRRMRQRARRISKASRDLSQELGRQATHDEVAKKLDLTPAAYSAALRLARTESDTVDANGAVEIADPAAECPEEKMQRSESLGHFATALDALPPRLKKILELYYGDDLTLRQIGNVLGVTEARISQLLSDAVKRLRAGCADTAAAANDVRPSSHPAPVSTRRVKSGSSRPRAAA